MDEQTPAAEGTTTIVVGVDGSDQALRAVEAAATEAQVFGCALEIVHGFIWPEMHVPRSSPVPAPATDLRPEADRIVAEAVARALRVAPGVAVSGQVVTGAAAPVLLHATADADLVVVGDRGLGGFTGLLVGSVAVALVTYGRAPVLVVRGRPEPSGPVVVGADGSVAASAAIDLALAYADAHGCPLRAVSVTSQASAQGADATLHHLDAQREYFPSVSVERVVHHGDARRVLIHESEGARLVVVGSRGRGGFAGLLLGSVGQAVLHHAACPVAVVPHATERVRLAQHVQARRG